jgi:hypothetical protein
MDRHPSSRNSPQEALVRAMGWTLVVGARNKKPAPYPVGERKPGGQKAPARKSILGQSKFDRLSGIADRPAVRQYVLLARSTFGRSPSRRAAEQVLSTVCGTRERARYSLKPSRVPFIHCLRRTGPKSALSNSSVISL